MLCNLLAACAFIDYVCACTWRHVTDVLLMILRVQCILRFSKSLQHVRKAQSEKYGRMYTYLKGSDHINIFAMCYKDLKIQKESVRCFAVLKKCFVDITGKRHG